MDAAQVLDDSTLIRRQAGQAVRALLRPSAYIGTAREAVTSAFHLAAYPLGVAPGLRRSQASPASRRLAQRSLLAQDPETARTPIILVHGYFHNRSAFLVMSRALERAGFQHVRGLNFNPLAQDLGELAAMLADEVERVLAATGARRCMLVGHSMGGLVARAYVQDLGGEDTVDTVITLGTPHRGTYTSLVGLGPAAAQMRPGSPFLRRLEETARPSGVRWVSYYSDLDLLMVPAVTAKLVHPALQANNVKLRDTGHLSLLLSGEVLRGVVRWLSNPSVGRPVEAGDAAPLASAPQRHGGPAPPEDLVVSGGRVERDGEGDAAPATAALVDPT